MFPSELEEGPQDLPSLLKNLAFQLVLDGEVSQVAHLRRDQCIRAGATEELCSRIWKSALSFSEAYVSPKFVEISRRFHFAKCSASKIVAGMID
ncbi:hypothetical protein ABQW72_00390 [Xanthomonas hortorum pv. pelargonii]|uniref:hypothetical protein n=1 Tax=Xanthomonas hortorum TaxID=56454 RepID=UPI0021CA9FFF|nr:hypothetical protein [Xanthomonas hortorum]MCU1709519.1 hypothetical protein [Xanthomonas hortorum pv. pelargonii]WCI07305.1 hypothetical protein PML25_22165 [Xanthomonas hortorum pv. pelargonii]WOB32960.1 hypothetical protein NYR98_22540 [Xanthomonas hortorum pv. pelargonii]